MQGFLITLLICSVTTSVPALFYMVITPLLAKRYSVVSRYYSWLFIVIGLMIPYRPRFGNAIVNVDMLGNAAVPMIRIGGRAPVPVTVGNGIPSSLPNLSWWQMIAVLWLAGMIIVLAYHMIRHNRFLKLAARWSEDVTDEKTLALIQNLKTQMGISQDIGLQLCDSIGSPMMIGFAKPRILLPNADFAEEELRFILKHELVHYRQKDLWYKCLVLIAAAIHWFNPIVYLMAKVIAVQCELSCDQNVVCNMGADARQHYIETMLGVVRHQSKQKTALSTNFYGGKKGMKRRLFSIIDRRRKKAGVAVLCSVMILTMGTGAAFAAKSETQVPPVNIQEAIREDIMVSPGSSFAYRFQPDPGIYSQYSSYGIAVSEDGERLLYNGQRVRLFADEDSGSEAFFLDEAGALDLAVMRNAAGKITSMEQISQDKAQEYRTAFFADDISAGANTQDKTGKNKYDQYSAYGIVYSSDDEVLQYKGQRVKLFADMLSDGSFETFWSDDAGTVNLSVERNAAGHITGIRSISEEQAQTYFTALDEYERNTLNELDEKK